MKHEYWVLINSMGKYLMQEDFNSYCFTDNEDLAVKFLCYENAKLKSGKLPMYKLTPKQIK